MTRILYWNIENFAENKINSVDGRRQVGSTKTVAEASADRWGYIRSVVESVDPQVFVVVEIESRPFVARGGLDTTAGARGCATLLRRLRGDPAGPRPWSLVPPLQTGPTESVAVFFRHDQLTFCGPAVWPGGAGPSARGGRTGDYPPDPRMHMDTALPPGNVPDGGNTPWPNAGLPVRRCAASTSFTWNAASNNHGLVAFGPHQRTPYHVCFVDSSVPPPPRQQPAPPPPRPRVLTIFAVHAPAHVTAEAYLRDLSKLAEITDPQADSEVRVVVGDFNVNLMDAQFARDPAYQCLKDPAQPTPPYDLLLDVDAVPMNPYEGFAAYFATHIKHRYSAIGWSTQDDQRVDPGYGYVGSDFGPPASAIDNAYVRYGNPALAPSHYFTIVNPVVGSPYRYRANGGPTGGIPFPRLVDYPPPHRPAPAPVVAPPYSPGDASAFRGWANYGYLRSTSDHLPLVMDV